MDESSGLSHQRVEIGRVVRVVLSRAVVRWVWRRREVSVWGVVLFRRMTLGLWLRGWNGSVDEVVVVLSLVIGDVVRS